MPLISKRLSLLRVAARCTVLRSRWCQSGVKSRGLRTAVSSAKQVRQALGSPPYRRGELPAETSLSSRGPLRRIHQGEYPFRTNTCGVDLYA